MPTITAYQHITKNDADVARLAGNPRTRVAMIVMNYGRRGFGVKDFVRHYPYPKLAEVHAAMSYYHDHRDEIDTDIQDELDQLASDPNANHRTTVWQKLKSQGLI